MSIEAMKQALEALDCIHSPLYVREIEKVGKAITALRAAIEQAEKPVECMCGICKLGKREWVGLTEIEICDIEADELTSASSETFSFARAIEAKLKEKVWQTAPRQWVGLSVNEARDFYESKLSRAELINKIDEFLEEKNSG